MADERIVPHAEKTTMPMLDDKAGTVCAEILVHHMEFTTSPGLDLAVISFVHEVVELVLHDLAIPNLSALRLREDGVWPRRRQKICSSPSAT